MPSKSPHGLNKLLVHLLAAVGAGVEKQTVSPMHNRASTLKRARPGLIVAVLVWSLIAVLSVGTNGALAAALAQHLSFPPGLVDAFSSLTGERAPQADRDLTDLFVPSPGPEIDHFQDSGLPPFAANGSALASTTIAHVPQVRPMHGGLLGLDFIRANASNHPLYVDSSAPAAAWTHGVANPIAITGPARAGRIVRGRPGGAISNEPSDDAQAPAPDVVVAPFVNEPVIDSVPWANPTPHTGAASTPTVDEIVTLDDGLPIAAQPPAMANDAPPIDFVREPRPGVDFAPVVAALAVTQVPAPGTLGLIAGAFVAWPIARRMRIGSMRRTRPIASPSPRD